MAYVLQAIIAHTTAFDRYQDEPWYQYVVPLSQGVSLLPLHELTGEAMGHWDSSAEQEFPPVSLESQFGEDFARFIQELSRDGVAGYIDVCCQGGPGDRWATAYQNGEFVLHQVTQEEDDMPRCIQVREESWWNRNRQKSRYKLVPNPDYSPNATDVVFELLGVCVVKEVDAWDELGMGRYRFTEEWPGGPECESM